MFVYVYSLGLPPTQDASHHQDYYIFSREPYKPSFATVTGWGVDPMYSIYTGFLLYIDIEQYRINRIFFTYAHYMIFNSQPVLVLYDIYDICHFLYQSNPHVL